MFFTLTSIADTLLGVFSSELQGGFASENSRYCVFNTCGTLLVLSPLIIIILMFQSFNTCRMRKWHHLWWENWLWQLEATLF